MAHGKIFKIAQRFRVKLAQQTYSSAVHMARQMSGLFGNIEILLEGAGDNAPQVRQLVRQLHMMAQSLVNDVKKYGVGVRTAGNYKLRLQALLDQIGGLIIVKRYLPLLRPAQMALDSFKAMPIPKQEKMVWMPIGPDEPEDPESDLPLPPGLEGVEEKCPYEDPRICELGYFPPGWSPAQRDIERQLPHGGYPPTS